MNNRRRARIKALKRQCRADMRKCSGHSAKFFVSLQYQERIGRVAWGDDMTDRMFRDFINLTRGVPYKRNLIWKKAVRTVKLAPMPQRDIDPLRFKPYLNIDKKRDGESVTVFKPVSVGPTWKMEDGTDG